MGVIRYQPSSIMQDMQNELNRLFDRNLADSDASNVSTSDWLPAVDIKEDAEKFTVYADIPGVSPEEIEVHMDNGMLSIRGEKKRHQTSQDDGFKRVERTHGTFYRRFSLPDSADSERIEAKVKHGVLELSIPKIEKIKARRIEVSADD